MKKLFAILLVPAFAIAVSTASFAAMDHSKMEMGNVAHEGVVDGVKASFKIMSLKERMKEQKLEMPKGMKETHHMMVEFNDAKSGKNLSEGQAKVKVLGPDKSEQVKDLIPMPAMSGMGAGFGADLVMDKKGKYGVMTKFKLKDGKTRSTKFWYTVK